MKKLFQDWSIFEITLLCISTFLIILSGIFCKSGFLPITTSFVGVLCALLQAKGKVVSQIVGLLEVALYTSISFLNQYFGEVLIYYASHVFLWCYFLV